MYYEGCVSALTRTTVLSDENISIAPIYSDELVYNDRRFGRCAISSTYTAVGE